MKILLLYPNSPIRSDPCCSGYEPIKLAPHEMILCAGNLREEHEVKILDAKAENLSFSMIKKRILDFNPNIVCLWTVQMYYLKDINLLKFAKENGFKTVLIMNDAIFLKQIMERFEFIDFTVPKLREFVLRNLMQNIKNPKLVKGIIFRKGKQVIDTGIVEYYDFSKVPLPAYDLAPMEKYSKDYIPIHTSRNCPFTCTFCFWGNSKWISRNSDQMIQEIEILISKYGYKYIGFLDQVFTMSRERVVDFCNEIVRKNLKFEWWCESTVNLVDEELLKSMYKSGCRRIFYGVEHVNEKILKNIKKYQTKEQIIKVIKFTKKAGIHPVLPLMIGLPGETKESIKELTSFIKKAKPWNYHVIFPIPHPGTVLYEQAKKNGWLLVEEKPENFYGTNDLAKPIIAIPPFTAKELIKARRKLHILPRLHPIMFINTLMDVYSRGGIKKISQVFKGAMRVVFNKPMVNDCLS